MILMKPIEVCKICFKDIKYISYRHLIFNKLLICDSCFDKLQIQIERFSIEGSKGISIYHYDEMIRELLFKLKGCYDIELAPIFLHSVARILHIKYLRYEIVPIPSWHEDDLKRGFNHVEEIFKVLKLPINKVLYKMENLKQATSSKNERTLMIDNLGIKDDKNIKGKNILLVDDVTTTGSSLKGAIRLLKKSGIKNIKILVMARNQNQGKTNYAIEDG